MTVVQTPLVMVPQIIRGKEFLPSRIATGEPLESPILAADIRANLADLHAIDYNMRLKLHQLSTTEIIDFLAAAGEILDAERNPHLAEALQSSKSASSTPAAVIEAQFSALPAILSRDNLERMASRSLPRSSADDWRDLEPEPGFGPARIRAFGANCLHVIAGNSPLIAVSTIIQSAICRCDSIIKVPSNNPLTAAAVLRTFRELDPSHPLVCSLSAIYWRGGTAAVEASVYGAPHLHKVIVWGGSQALASAHRYTGPEVELISFGPKISASIVDLTSDRDGEHVWLPRLARDVSSMGQEACFNTRVVYVVCDQAADRGEVLRNLASGLLRAISAVPENVRGVPPPISADLLLDLEGICFADDGSFLVRSASDPGAMLCSPSGAPVDFVERLQGFVANLVAVATPEEALACFSRHTQTVSVYPSELQLRLRDRLALRGVQRVVALGQSDQMIEGAPHDFVEPMRRLCNWAVDQSAP